jgi:uncharacterized protein (TIGR03435 family)
MAQAPQTPRFEVASVRRAEQFAGRGDARITTDPGRIVYTNIVLKSLLSRAYGVRRDQVLGPDWLETEQYHLSAKLPEGAREDQIPAMLQNLLTERFRMTVRRESKVQPAYVLMTGRDGPKLKSAADPELAAKGSGLSMRQRDGTLIEEMKGTTLAGLANHLIGVMRRPVFDQTGIKGYYDIELELDARDPSGSIFRALQALGLKLESRDMPVEYP